MSLPANVEPSGAATSLSGELPSMPRAMFAIASLLLFGGEAFGADWPSWLTFPSRRPFCPAAPQPKMGCSDDSPLCPEITHWTFAKSQCKQPLCGNGLSKLLHCGPREVHFYPPLQYGRAAANHANAPAPPPAPASTPAPAETPAPAPPPTTSPDSGTPDSTR
jgi:hypothetical protein